MDATKRRFVQAAIAWPAVLALPACRQEGAGPAEIAGTFFSPDEYRFVEAAAARLIPGEDNDPGALEAGVPLFIDLQLAGPYGRADRWYMEGPWADGTAQQGYQLRQTPAQLYRTAIAGIDGHCRHHFDGKAFAHHNVHLLLLSGIGKPYDPFLNTGVVGRNYAYQITSAVEVFVDELMNPYMGAGALGQAIDDFNGDNFDHGPEGFIGGGYIALWTTGGRPIMQHHLAGWNLLFFEPGVYTQDPAQSTLWNRGAYLVQGPGHCAACHTPKNMLGGTDRDRALQGGDAGEGWFAPGLTGNRRTGLGGWSEQDIVEYLKTGANPHTASSGPMTEVVMNSTQHLGESDLRAIATYLKSIPAHETEDENPEPIDDQAMARGEALYVDQCMGCHMADGEGQPDAFPPLANTSSVQAPNAQTLIQVVLAGDHMADPPSLPTGLAMPAFGWKLGDQQIADVLTYIRNSWGNRAPAVRAQTVADMRESVHEHGPRHKRLISGP